MRLAVLLLVAAALSGCLRTEVTASIDETLYEETDILHFSLDDFTGDGMWIEVVLREYGTVNVDIDRDLRLGSGQGAGAIEQESATPDICTWLHAGFDSKASIDTRIGGFVRTALQGQEQEVRFDMADDAVQEPISLTTPWVSDTPMPIFIALNDVAFWQDDGATFDVTIDAPGEFLYRRLPDPDFTCLTQPDQFQGGSYSDAGTARTVSDQVAALPVHGQARSLVMVSSDGTYDFMIRDPDGAVLDHGASPVGNKQYEFYAYEWGPGTYRFEVDDLTGHNADGWLTFAGIMVLDVQVPAAPA